MKALILAAGRGSRLKEHTEDKPKGLLPVNGIPLIERSIKNLQQCGIEKVIVIVGYLHHMLEEFITQKFGDFCQLVYNTDYTRGSGSSFICAAPHMDGEMIMVESDLLYDKRIIQRMMAQSEKNAFAKGNFNHGRKEIKIFLQDGFIKEARWGGPEEKADGDWVGFTKLSTKATSDLRNLLLSTDPNQGKEINYEDFIFTIFNSNQFITVDIDDLPWLEVDNADDFVLSKDIAAKIDQQA